MFLDAHIHLQDIQEENVRVAVLSQADTEGIGRLFCNGIRPEDWPVVNTIARQDKKVVPFLGVHPWYADKVSPGWDGELEKFLQEQPDAGIGEIGLDKSKEAIDFTKQKEVFLRQLEIAGRFSRPVAIHGVRAWGDLLTLLRDHKPPHVRFMMHSYHGSPETLYELLNFGAFISFSWKWLREQKKNMMDLIRRVPLERLLLETDFPYTEPMTKGDSPSQAFKGTVPLAFEKYFHCLHEAYAIAAQARGVTEEQLQKAVWDNGAAFLHRASAR